MIPATTTHSGNYTHITKNGDNWEYAYEIHAAGSRSERRVGRLRADALESSLTAAKPGDSVQTPWGVMLRVSDTPYERGFLLEHTQGKPIDVSQGVALNVPESSLARGGEWWGEVGPWSYRVDAYAMGSKSERRIGALRFHREEVTGSKEGDYADTPWGRLRWMGRVDISDTTDYEQGFLLRGTYDRSLDELEGDAVFPKHAEVTMLLESLYLEAGFRVSEGARPARSVMLQLTRHPGPKLGSAGKLSLDPNTCELDDFGDREGCTEIAPRAYAVTVTKQRLADPKHLGRQYFAVEGDSLPPGLALIVQGKLELGTFERCYLKLGRQLASLYVADEA